MAEKRRSVSAEKLADTVSALQRQAADLLAKTEQTHARADQVHKAADASHKRAEAMRKDAQRARRKRSA